ncbi:MAG TPA: hypothetical protein VF660_08205 [Actinomycetota bacterium]
MEEREETPSRGRITRWFFGDEARPATIRPELPQVSADVIDLRDASPAEVLAARVERLEAGMRLMADTMKRVYGDISGAVQLLTYEIRNQRGPSNVNGNLQQSIASLNLTIDELLHSMRAFPHVLAAATDELSQRIDIVETRTTEALAGLLESRTAAGDEPKSNGNRNGNGHDPGPPKEKSASNSA